MVDIFVAYQGNFFFHKWVYSQNECRRRRRDQKPTSCRNKYHHFPYLRTKDPFRFRLSRAEWRSGRCPDSNSVPFNKRLIRYYRSISDVNKRKDGKCTTIPHQKKKHHAKKELTNKTKDKHFIGEEEQSQDRSFGYLVTEWNRIN